MKYLFIVLLLAGLTACTLNPEAAKKKHVASGNEYYAKGEYERALSMYRKALDIDQRYGEAYYRSGLASLKLQRWDEAGRNLQRAVELQPQNLNAHVEVINLYLFLHHIDPSIRKFVRPELDWMSVRMQERFPHEYDTARLLGYLALFSNNQKAALEQFERANRAKPRQPEVVGLYADTLAATGQAGAAEKLAFDMIQADPGGFRFYDFLTMLYIRTDRPAEAERVLRLKLDKNPKAPEGYLELAAYYFTKRQWPEMLETLRRLAASRNDIPAAPLLIGDFYLRVRDWDRGLEQYQSCMQRESPEKSQCRKRMVEILLRQNKRADAQRIIQEGLKEDQKDPEALAIRASLLVSPENKEQLQSAIRDLQSVVHNMPRDFVLRYVLGRALLLSGDAESARMQFEEATKIRPDYLHPRVALAQLLLEQKSYGKVLVAVRQILSQPFTDVPFETAGQRPEQRPFYGQILRMPAEDPAGFTTLAHMLADREVGVEEAFILASRAWEQRPAYNVADTIGWIHLKRNQTDTALNILRELVQKQPDRATYRYHLAMAYLGKGEREQAKKECEAALQVKLEGDEELKIRTLLLKLN
jgi:tetratricopeptide (TPR) repeat protein